MSNGLPRHVAIIMDGNGRWAKKRHQPRVAGHRAGVENVRSLVQQCIEIGVECLTLFAFSSENWRRPPTEVRLLMDLFVSALREEMRRLHENGVRLAVIGDRAVFSPRLQAAIAEAEALTRHNERLKLNVAANYGGRWDITEAARGLAEEVRAGQLDPAAITPELLGARLSLAGLPEPDLFIRSGGEQRISNFMLWRVSYSELIFSEKYWPDYSKQDLDQAFIEFTDRERRFGGN